MVIENGTKASNKASKGSKDRIKALEVSIYELRQNESDKNWQNVDKNIQVLLKVSDLQAIKEHEHLLINLQWILTNTKSPSGPVLNTVALLSKICNQMTALRTFLRDSLGLMATLTALLVTLQSSPTKSIKILDLMKFIAPGITIIRQESFLEKLIFQLLKYVQSKDSSHLSPALGILACLCSGNYIVGKFLLASMTTEERKELYSCNFEDAKTRVYLDFLLTTLSRRHFAFKNKYGSVERHLSTLSDAFCAAYSEADCFTMRLCVDFLQDFQKQTSADVAEEKPQNEAVMDVIRQLFCIADFSEGSNEANGLLFSFARHLASAHGPSLQLIDVTSKALSLLLETSSSPNFVNEGVLMMSTVLEFVDQNEQKEGQKLCSKNETMMSTLRLQIDSLLASFNDILGGSSSGNSHEWKTIDEDLLTSLTSILECGLQMAKIDDWAELVGTHFAHPSLMLARLRNLEGNDDDRLLSSKASLLAAFFQLAETLKSNHKKWDKLLSNEEEVEAIVKVWVQCFEKKCQRERHAYYHQLIYGHAKATDIFLRLLRRSENLEDENVNKEEMVLNSKMSKLDMTNKVKDIDRLLAQLASWMENNDVNECLADVWELQEYKLMVHQSKMEALREALKAADEQLSQQKSLNTQLELENQRLNSFTRTLLHRVDVTQKEIVDVRQQCDSINKDASEFRTQTLQELKSKQEDIEVYESNQEKLEAKVTKYKEKCEVLQETIKEHQSVQDDLHEKLKAEAKTNSELSEKIAKREERLKKKEKLLEEELKAHEELKTEVKSLQTLNKRLETTLSKKEKQCNEANEKLNTFKQIQAQIFSLSKTVSDNGEDE